MAYLKHQVELLSMTAGERALKHQLDTLKEEVKDIRKQMGQSEITKYKGVSE